MRWVDDVRLMETTAMCAVSAPRLIANDRSHPPSFLLRNTSLAQSQLVLALALALPFALCPPVLVLVQAMFLTLVLALVLVPALSLVLALFLVLFCC